MVSGMAIRNSTTLEKILLDNNEWRVITTTNKNHAGCYYVVNTKERTVKIANANNYYLLANAISSFKNNYKA